MCNMILKLILSFLTMSCAPFHVNQHEIPDRPLDRCGLGSSRIPIWHPDVLNGTIELQKDSSSNELILSGSFNGRIGKSILISAIPVSVIFSDGKKYQVPLKLNSYQGRSDVYAPKVKEIPLGIPYVFKLEKDYDNSAVGFEGKFPFQAIDLEIELPKITFGTETLPIKIIKYKFINRWTFVPLNGC